VLPGCHAFGLRSERPQLRVFVRTPRGVIAARAMSRKVADRDVEQVLDAHLSPTWRAIERYEDKAGLIVSGLESHDAQIEAVRRACMGQ
jgi:uridine kinase